jgi:hypothetical protein
LSTIEGRVILVGNRVAGASVTLYAAGEGTPTEVARSKTDAEGRFQLDARSAPEDSVLYVVAKGPNQAVALMTLLGTSFPKTITVNELTTVASTFTAVRFINGDVICGNRLGLRIAAGNTPNLVDPETGGWGKVILDPGNSTWTTTLANLNTLGSLISAFATVANDDWRSRFLQASNFYRSGDAQEHSRSDGWHRSYAMGQPEGALRVVRRSLPATEGRCPA